MAREYGWAPVGERAVGARPGRSWKTLTLIGAIRLGQKPKLMTHRGAVNGKVFLRYVRRRLAPWLKPGDIVLMDNLSAHKVKGVRAAIEAVSAFVLYLPAYSPDMNPIELRWAHLKRDLRRIGLARSKISRAPHVASAPDPPSTTSMAGFDTAYPSLRSVDPRTNVPMMTYRFIVTSILAAVLSACGYGDAFPGYGCAPYIRCYEATGGVRGTLEGRYGLAGTCWTTEAESTQCLNDCRNKLNTLKAIHPDAGC